MRNIQKSSNPPRFFHEGPLAPGLIFHADRRLPKVQPMINLRPCEYKLVGSWIAVNGAVDGDDNCKRIEELVRNHLQQVGASEDGWTMLFVDENDGRYWEQTYPHGEWHGGGPPTLTHVLPDYVRSKYKLDR